MKKCNRTVSRNTLKRETYDVVVKCVELATPMLKQLGLKDFDYSIIQMLTLDTLPVKDNMLRIKKTLEHTFVIPATPSQLERLSHIHHGHTFIDYCRQEFKELLTEPKYTFNFVEEEGYKPFFCIFPDYTEPNERFYSATDNIGDIFTV